VDHSRPEHDPVDVAAAKVAVAAGIFGLGLYAVNDSHFWGLLLMGGSVAYLIYSALKKLGMLGMVIGCFVFVVIAAASLPQFKFYRISHGLRGDTANRQNAQGLQYYVNQGPQTKEEEEIARRQSIVKALRNEYILSHNSISSGLLGGTEFPPDDWMNKRLARLGEKWTVSSGIPRPPADSPPRSFVVLEGNPLFNTLVVGHKLFFNYYFRAPAANPNQVNLVSPVHRWLYLAPDSSRSTQEAIVSNFLSRAKASQETDKLLGSSYDTMLPGDRLWNDVTAAADNDERSPRFITQSDLDALHYGTKIVFLLLEIPYTDYGKLHHLRTCTFLSSPAEPPGIWHICEVTFASD
jgi:hypothetical protein